MASSFGARLQAQRERHQITLESVAEQTKIRSALLHALEHDDVSAWPPGIFRRSYLRDYSLAIGVDPEATLREFLALYPDPVEEPETNLEATAAASERPGRRPPMRLQYLIASAIGAVPKAFSSRPKQTPLGAPERSAPAHPTIEVEAVAISQREADPALIVTAKNDRASVDDIASTRGVSLDVAAIDLPVIEFGQSELSREAAPVDEQLELPCIDLRVPVHIDLPAVANLCRRLVEANGSKELEPLLEDASRILHAVGIIVWPWDPARGVLWPSLSYGYPRQTLAKLPTLAPDAANPIGAAFRGAAPQVVAGGGSATGAIVVPLTTARGCVGVLAVECSSGLEQEMAIQAVATILAAQLALLVSAESLARTAIA